MNFETAKIYFDISLTTHQEISHKIKYDKSVQ